MKEGILQKPKLDGLVQINPKHLENPFGVSREELDELAYGLIAVCIIRLVPKMYFSRINEYFNKVDICDGDWIVSYPKSDMSEIITSYKIIHNAQRIVKTLKTKLMEYTKRRDINFGELKFYVEAQLNVFEDKENHLTKVNDINLELKNENNALRSMISDLKGLTKDHQKAFDENSVLLRKINDMGESRDKSLEEIRVLREEIDKQNKLIIQKDKLISSYSEKCKASSKFPTYLQDIPEWIDREFDGYIEMHSRAISELKKCKRPEVTPYVLSTAIYCIYGYARCIKSEISSEERDCFYRIDIPWEVTSSGKEKIRVYNDDYSISVKKSNGKNKKVELDWHLKHGISSNDLIRIYFCWDKDKKKVLIGSLPDHLS